MDKSRVLPKFRQDVVMKIIENNGEKKLLIFDQSKIAPQPLIFPAEFYFILQFFDGVTTLGQFEKIIAQNYEGETEQFLESLSNLIDELDYLLYLETPNFFKLRDEIVSYINSKVRKSVCAGFSYSTEPVEIHNELNVMLSFGNDAPELKNPRAIIVPHIDFRIGQPAHQVYGKAYKYLIGNDYDAFIIFGTSHYGNSDYFMFTKKDFETPLGVATTDKDFINELNEHNSFELTFDDLAHYSEHSIEFQVLWLQHIFPDKEIKIVPILVGSFHEFVQSNELPIANEKIRLFLGNLKRLAYEKYKKPLFVAGVDFCHVGRKFQDPYDGRDVLEEVHKHDYELIEKIKKCDSQGFFGAISKVKDKYKVCGLSPIYALLNVICPSKIHFVARDYWDDFQTSSIVSFASFVCE